MDPVVLFFAAAVGWFSLICLRIAVLIYQFVIFPGTFGRTTNISLRDLAELADTQDVDLPRFNIVIPAYQESLVIDGTLRRIAAINYPRTHYDVWVVTYEDEVPEPGQDSTYNTAIATAAAINADAGRQMVRTLLVPAGFDGRFPGTLTSTERFVGKPRGLNYALRTIHESNERQERTLYVGKMARLGRIDAVSDALDAAEAAMQAGAGAFDTAVAQHFDPEAAGFAGPCALSSQIWRAQKILLSAKDLIGPNHPATQRLEAFVTHEAPRFFLCAAPGAVNGVDLAVMDDRHFLYEVMREVESSSADALAASLREIEARLSIERPRLKQALDQARDAEQVFQLCRQVNSRWMSVYDADADAPVDLLRHLAGRILTDPDVMGFQGPVSPIANYDEVHPLCKLGGLWMGFWHSTGYPRLLSRDSWAHVLAGTNWCFRIDGFRKGDRLVRSTDYREADRRFILSFDPRQLTEDLEVAVRIFNDWKVNAQWHPYVEFEQVPASPRAMIVQRRRWTLGTLQTVGYMLRARIPIAQKLRYGLLPLDIVVSGSGPIVTVFLWILIYTGDLISSPILVAWSVFLTFGNIVYVLPYLLAHERFVMGFRRSAGVDYAIRAAPALSQNVRNRLAGGAISHPEADLLHDISTLLDRGRQPGGFMSRYLAERCVDDSADGAGARLIGVTPSLTKRGDLPGLADTYLDLTEHSYVAISSKAAPDETLLTELAQMKSVLEKSAGTGAWRTQKRRERRQIWLWAFAYLFWQLIPYYSGLINWLTGRNSKTWVKTPRTRKTNLARPD